MCTSTAGAAAVCVCRGTTTAEREGHLVCLQCVTGVTVCCSVLQCCVAVRVSRYNKG